MRKLTGNHTGPRQLLLPEFHQFITNNSGVGGGGWGGDEVGGGRGVAHKRHVLQNELRERGRQQTQSSVGRRGP
jgi:hypothetical protein